MGRRLFHTESMLSSNAAERSRASRIHAREVARVIMRIETTLIVAAHIEAFDDRTVFAERLAVCVRDNAMDGHQKLTANTCRIERSLRNIA